MLTHPDRVGPRLDELDSLRGLAALVVFLTHSLLLFPRLPPWLAGVLTTPLALFLVGGHVAVLLFFLLSGFVLFLPYTTASPSRPYGAYLVKRVCRIYLPYLAGTAVAVVLFLQLGQTPPPAGISGFYSWHPLPASQLRSLLLSHVLMLGSFHREYLNGSTWSLAEEMRISLIFPLLAVLVRALRPRVLIPLVGGVSLAASAGMLLIQHRFPLATLHYAAIFMAGSLLCRSRARLLALWERLRGPWQLVIVLLALCVVRYAGLLQAWHPFLFTEEVCDWIAVAGCCIVLVHALDASRLHHALRHPALQHMGRVSYSFYLLHLPLLYAGAALFWASLPHALTPLLAFVATLALAQIFYVGVERPCIALGKRLERLIAPGRRAVTPLAGTTR